MTSAGDLWSVDEYVLRAELADGGLREIIAEGSRDRAFFEDVLWGSGVEVLVLDRSYLEIDAREIEAEGLAVGVKGALLTVARRLSSSSDYANNGAVVGVVVDRDFDGLPDGVAGVAFATDPYSIEGYGLNEDALERFVRFILVREVRPTGRQGPVPVERNACTGRALFGRVMPACQEVATVRLALWSHSREIGVLDGWLSYCDVGGDGAIAVRSRELLEASCLVRGAVPGDVSVWFDEARAAVRSDPLRFISGGDFVDILHKIMKSPWGRRMTSVRFAQVDRAVLTGWVLGSVDHNQVVGQPLFAELLHLFGAKGIA